MDDTITIDLRQANARGYTATIDDQGAYISVEYGVGKNTAARISYNRAGERVEGSEMANAAGDVLA